MSKTNIRPASLTDCSSLAQVLISANERAFRGRVPDTCLDHLTLEESARNWAKNFAPDGNFYGDEHLLVATQGKQVIGFIMSGTLSAKEKADLPTLESFSREFRVLSVAPAWHRKGVGRLLVSNLAKLLLAEKATKLFVRCLEDNPYCIFYERLGAVKFGTSPYNWEGYQTTMGLYGWADMSSFELNH